jgi:hypothetical protein
MAATGLIPKFFHRFATAGINLPPDIFHQSGGRY